MSVAPGAGSVASLLAADDALAMAGVSMTRSDLMPAGPFAAAVMPATVEIALSTGSHFARDVVASGWQAQRVALGSARIDLDGYRLTIDDVRAELVIDNLASGTSARVWGDAMLGAGERTVGQFWGTTSLQLANGLFITCGTAQAADNPNLYRLDRLTITKGAAALVVSAIGGDGGDMALTGTDGNWALEEDTRDGLVLVEAEGGMWRTEYGAVADAATLEQTAPGGFYGPGEEAWSGREFGRVMSRFAHAMMHGATSSYSASATLDFAMDSRRYDGVTAALIRAEHRRAALLHAKWRGAVASGGTNEVSG